MSSEFEKIAGAARGAFYGVFGVPIDYAQEETTLSGIVAVSYDPSTRASFAEMADLWAGYLDFQIKTADLEGLEPQRGDSITLAGGEVYRVLSPEGVPVWTYSDPEGMEMIVHTKQTGK
jgi:hypothetical protein